ncbi:MAG: ThiF family adenylyltransferase, partial [Flavobacteriaceae bacterium]
MMQERYRRQIQLKEFGLEGQRKLAESKVLVIGAGGLGIPVAQYLNAMGVGTLGIVDGDTVSVTNLHRQVLFHENDTGRLKVEVLAERLSEQNSDTDIQTYSTFLDVDNALGMVDRYDLVVDASDNFPTRYLVNDACVILDKPFVSGALHGFEGQVSVFNYQKGPTYRCLFPKMPSPGEVPDCNTHGVLGILPGIIGSLQALEAVKVLTGTGEPLSGSLLLYDGRSQQSQKIKFPAQPDNFGIIALQDSYGWGHPCESVPSITVDELKGLLAGKGQPQLVDVRTPVEFVEFHLPNALNLPLDTLDAQIRQIDAHRPVYLICQSGMRS